uniref:Uncharacterized protein n=1 Tax=Oryza sativa subsp. japonica TaxID=39947 RepID=Q9LIV2_ORYSJ|nr:unnamed protein product [Oryza sativa]
MASASTAVASATAGTTRSFEKLSAPWMIGRGHVALPPSPGRYPAVTVAAASRRTGEEIEAPSSTPPVRTTDKESTKPASETGITKKGSAIRRVTLVVLAAVFFGVSIALRDGVGKASEYFAGYLLEQSLSVDNLFVFVLVFKYFKVPQEYQLFAEEDEESDLSDNFIVKTCQRFIPVTDYYDGDRFFTTQEGLWKPAIGIVLGFIGTKMVFDFFATPDDNVDLWQGFINASFTLITRCRAVEEVLEEFSQDDHWACTYSNARVVLKANHNQWF